MKPVLLAIAGPNGSGKTTVTRRLRQERWSEGVEYLNPDEVAQERFGDWNSPDAVRKAADWTDARREELLAERRGIAFETVLSTQTSDPRINAARVAGRVLEGGHTVPIEKILSRYARSLANLSAVIRVADRAYIYDNSIDDMDARLFARTSDGRVRKVYGDLPGWIDDALQGVPAHEELTDLRVTKASD